MKNNPLRKRSGCRMISYHGFKNELCYMCTVLVSTQSFKNELCHMRGMLVLTHGTTIDQTSGDSIGIDVFPVDPMDSIGRLPTLNRGLNWALF